MFVLVMFFVVMVLLQVLQLENLIGKVTVAELRPVSVVADVTAISEPENERDDDNRRPVERTSVQTFVL